MDPQVSEIPNVLVFAGHDPSGGAGIQADIESIIANGCRSVSVITSLTAQSTTCFNDIYPQKASQFRKETELLISDISISACKIGLIGKINLIDEICDVLAGLPSDFPVVFDPVLVTGTGKSISDTPLVTAMKKQLFSHTTVLTPNTAEVRLLTGDKDIHKAAGKLLEWGCRSVLVTGADENTSRVENFLFGRDMKTEHFHWDRLPGIYHGSGCTLSSAIAAQMARGVDLITAIRKAQEYTWQSLKHGFRIGKNQMHPNRMYKFEV